MEILKAGAIVRRLAGKEVQILLLHQLKHNYWSFPKGHCEQGETTEQTAKREALEESGLQIRIIKQLGALDYFDVDHNSVKLTLFLAEAESSVLQAEHGCELVWTNIAKAIHLISYPNLKEFVQSHKDEIISGA